MERTVAPVCGALVLAVALCVASPHAGRRLVCWKAILKCHGEPECHYAYDQYLYACASVLSGERRKCPSHCIASLVQLNLTRGGPPLEDCDCALDPVCRRTRQAIEPCLPRTRTLGCTEARRQCEADLPCSLAMNDYLFHCRRLFGGDRCSDECRRVIAGMRAMPRARQLDTCVCDGADRTICEHVKVSMKAFCSDAASERFAGSGLSDSEEDADDDYPEPDDYDAHAGNSAGDAAPRRSALGVLTTILVLVKFM